MNISGAIAELLTEHGYFITWYGHDSSRVNVKRTYLCDQYIDIVGDYLFVGGRKIAAARRGMLVTEIVIPLSDPKSLDTLIEILEQYA